MRIAYLDSSCLVANASGERGAAALARHLTSFDELVASNLLEAEVRAAFLRESVEVDGALFGGLSWVIPDRPLTQEIARLLDVLHVARRRMLASGHGVVSRGGSSSIGFLTLDARQQRVAHALGFETLNLG